jgi:hypothetical protein
MSNDSLTEANFFTTDEVYKLAALVNESLESVSYHFWVNTAQGQRFEVLDWISLHFVSGHSMWLTAGEETDGIKLIEADFPSLKKRLEEEFKGAVTLESKDVSGHKFWEGAIGKAITPSLIHHEDRVLNDSIALHFEGSEDSIEIFLGIEGLEVDYFEE